MDLEPGQRWAELRASDADREQIVSVLRQHHADGRLTVEEFTDRMQRAFMARTYGDLDLLTRDLPPLPPPLPEPPRADPALLARRRFHRHLLSYLLINGFLVVIWAVGSLAAGHLAFFWPLWTLVGWGFALGWQAVRLNFAPEAGGDQGDHGDHGDRNGDGHRGGDRNGRLRGADHRWGSRRRPQPPRYHYRYR